MNPKKKILLVDDEPSIRFVLTAVLEQRGYEVEVAEDGYAALRKILAFGQSWIALDGGTVVGFALIDAAEAGRHWGEEERLNLRYAAGAALDGLLAKALARGVPVTATVREANRSGLAAALVRAGFRQSETRVGELRFQYEP